MPAVSDTVYKIMRLKDVCFLDKLIRLAIIWYSGASIVLEGIIFVSKSIFTASFCWADVLPLIRFEYYIESGNRMAGVGVMG